MVKTQIRKKNLRFENRDLKKMTDFFPDFRWKKNSGFSDFLFSKNMFSQRLSHSPACAQMYLTPIRICSGWSSHDIVLSVAVQDLVYVGALEELV